MKRRVFVLIASLFCLLMIPVCALAFQTGDLNMDGSVTEEDALLLVRNLARLEKLSNEQYALADLNADGQVDNRDAVVALRVAARRLPNIVLSSVTVDQGSAASSGGVWTWKAEASGGDGNLQYAFEIYNGANMVSSRDYDQSPEYVYTPTESGVYKARVLVRDITYRTVVMTSAETTYTPPTGDDVFTFALNDNNNTATVTGYTGDTDADIVIPASIVRDGKKYDVVEIGVKAFYERSDLTGRLTIPGSVTAIGDSAFFECGGLTGSLTIPDGVTSIEAWAFWGCSGFTGSLTIPGSVTSIGNCAFSGCRGFTGNLTIPDGVTSIEYNTFYNCSGFTGRLTIPDRVTSIGSYAFYNCSGFTGSLTIPNGVTDIRDSAFYGCRSFTGSLDIPDSVISIEWNAFRLCTGFTGGLSIPDSVLSIRAGAFSGCANLTSATIPSSVKQIGDNAFPYPIRIYCDIGSAAEQFAARYGYPAEPLTPPSTLSGSILNADKSPFTGVVAVYLYPEGDLTYKPAVVYTNTSGVWRYGGYDLYDHYTVKYIKDGYAFSANNIWLRPGDSADDVVANPVSSQGILVSGSVINDNGDGVPSIRVRISDAETNEIMRVTETMQNGCWSARIPSSASEGKIALIADGYLLSKDAATFSMNADYAMGSVTARIIQGEGDAVTFTVDTLAISVGERAEFTVSAPNCDTVRIIVDSVAHESYAVYNGTAFVNRLFNQGGSRSVRFQGRAQNTWGGVSEAAVLEVTSLGTLEPPVFSLPSEHLAATPLRVTWAEVEHAAGYSIYLYQDGDVLDMIYTEELEAELSGILLKRVGDYTVEIIASGVGYSQRSASHSFRTLVPAYSATLTTPRVGDEFIVGNELTIVVDNPDGGYISALITLPDGETVELPEESPLGGSTVTITYPITSSGEYLVEANVWAFNEPYYKNALSSACEPRVVQVVPSQIFSVNIAGGTGSELLADSISVSAVTNTAVTRVEIVENNVVLLTMGSGSFTQANYRRTFTGTLNGACAGRHNLSFIAYDTEDKTATAPFTLYVVTPDSLSMPLYAARENLSLKKYPDQSDTVQTLNGTEALDVVGAYDDMYYLRVQGTDVYGYARRGDVFEWSPQAREAINITVRTETIAPAQDYVGQGRKIDIYWLVENLPDGASVQCGLLNNKGDPSFDPLISARTASGFESDRVETDISDLATDIPSTLYFAVVRVYDANGRLLKWSLSPISIYRSESIYNAYTLPSNFDKAFCGEAGKGVIPYIAKQSVAFADRAYRYDDCKKALTALGFESITPYNYDKGSESTYSSSSVGFTLARKLIVDDSGNPFWLIAIIIRGTTGNEEWITNFDLGYEGKHSSFNKSARDALDKVSQYIESFTDEEKQTAQKYKAWITGHSRGAAVANLLAGGLLKTIPSSRVKYFKNGNVFAYTFACPSVSKFCDMSAPVFNFNIGADAVPCMPLASWGYSRNGKTYTLGTKDAEKYGWKDFPTAEQTAEFFADIGGMYGTDYGFYDAWENSIRQKEVDKAASGKQLTGGDILTDILFHEGLTPSAIITLRPALWAEWSGRVAKAHELSLYREWINNAY